MTTTHLLPTRKAALHLGGQILTQENQCHTSVVPLPSPKNREAESKTFQPLAVRCEVGRGSVVGTRAQEKKKGTGKQRRRIPLDIVS